MPYKPRKSTKAIVAFKSRSAYKPRNGSTIRGRGAYFTVSKPFQRTARNVAGVLGSAAGSYFGNPRAGANLAKQFSTILFGKGAYKLARKNSLMYASPVPSVHSSAESVRVRHRECLYDINSSTTTFSQIRYALNPGMNETFPWLSGIASNFQEYRFEGLVFEFKSLCGESISGVNNTLGSVMMATQYNPLDASFINKQQLLNESGAMDAKPSENLIHFVECDPHLNTLTTLYIRSSGAPAGSDLRLYDLGTTTVATYGSQSIADVGEIWVSYDVILMKPKITGALALTSLTSHYGSASNPSISFPLQSIQPRFEGIGLTYAATTSTFTFPQGLQGVFMFNVTWTGTVASTAVPTINTTLTNAFNSPLCLNGNSPSVQSPPAGGASLGLNYIVYINITDPSLICKVQFSAVASGAGLFMSGTTTTDVFIQQVNNSVI